MCVRILAILANSSILWHYIVILSDNEFKEN